MWKMCNSLSIGIKSPKQITEISQSRNIFSTVGCYQLPFSGTIYNFEGCCLKTFVLKFTAYIMIVWSQIVTNHYFEELRIVMFDNIIFFWISIKAL